jgi:hypothetical protein
MNTPQLATWNLLPVYALNLRVLRAKDISSFLGHDSERIRLSRGRKMPNPKILGLQGLAKGCGQPVTIWEAQINAFVAAKSKNLIYLE